MRFWIAKNSEIPVREQIVTQVTLAIASGELAVGGHLPSTAELARRFSIHSNTVSHAYQELADQGWIEFRKGSGYVVRDSDAELGTSLERFVADFIRESRRRGYAIDEVRDCFSRFLPGQSPGRVLLLEDDEDYRDILIAEIAAALDIPVDGTPTAGFDLSAAPQNAVLAAMFDERPKLGTDLDCHFLNARSVAEAMSHENRPDEADLIAVVSGWEKFLLLARTMLVAARIHPDSLIVRKTGETEWRNGIDAATIVICDARTAAHFADDGRLRVFRLIADDSIEDLRRLLF